MFSYGTRIQWKSVFYPHTHHLSIHPSIHHGELVGGVVYSHGECVDSNFTQSSSNKLLLLFWLFKTLITHFTTSLISYLFLFNRIGHDHFCSLHVPQHDAFDSTSTTLGNQAHLEIPLPRRECIHPKWKQFCIDDGSFYRW